MDWTGWGIERSAGYYNRYKYRMFVTCILESKFIHRYGSGGAIHRRMTLGRQKLSMLRSLYSLARRWLYLQRHKKSSPGWQLPATPTWRTSSTEGRLRRHPNQIGRTAATRTCSRAVRWRRAGILKRCSGHGTTAAPGACTRVLRRRWVVTLLCYSG